MGLMAQPTKQLTLSGNPEKARNSKNWEKPMDKPKIMIYNIMLKLDKFRKSITLQKKSGLFDNANLK